MKDEGRAYIRGKATRSTRRGTRGGQRTASCTPFAASVPCAPVTVATQSPCPSLYAGLMMGLSAGDATRDEGEEETSATSVPGHPARPRALLRDSLHLCSGPSSAVGAGARRASERAVSELCLVLSCASSFSRAIGDAVKWGLSVDFYRCKRALRQLFTGAHPSPLRNPICCAMDASGECDSTTLFAICECQRNHDLFVKQRVGLPPPPSKLGR